MRPFLRKAMAAALVAFVSFVAACSSGGGDGPTGIKPPPPVDTTPKPVTIVRVVLSATTMMVVGDTKPVSVVATRSDSSTVVVDAPVTSSVPSVVAISANGMVAVAPGSAQLNASYPGYTVAPLGVVVAARPVTVVSVAIVGDTTTEMPDTKQYRLVTTYSDSLKKDVVTVWSYPSPDWIAGYVNPTGLLTPHALGVIRVQATYGGTVYTMQVRVVGTPRSTLPPISDTGWAWMWDHTRVSNGVLMRLPAGEKKVFVGAGFNAVKAMSAATRASILLKGALTFVQVSDSASASIFFTTNPSTKIFGERCAGGEQVFTPEAMAIGGIVMVDSSTLCINDEDLILHELFHALGFGGHVTEPGIMSAQGITPGFGPLFTEVAQWFYDPRVKYGSIPIP